MIRNTLYTLCLGAMLASFTHAAEEGEYTVDTKPFKKITTLSGVFLPTESTAVSIAPEEWTDFTITSFVSQGAAVKKGDILIGIDTTKLDKYIAKAEKSRELDILNLAQAKQTLAQLEITTPRSLEKHARAEKEAAENLKWFTEHGMPRDIETTKRGVKSAELMLAYQLEELKQLEKMYAEDNKTEETEEIILIRTRNDVDRAKFRLKSAKISAARTLDTDIPRQLKSAQRSAEESRIANTAAKKSLTRALEIKRLEVAKAIKDDSEKADKLAKMKADRAMMNITAAADGVVYYGSMDNGRWNPATAMKVLKIGGKLPAHLTLMTFIPAKAPLTISAFAKEADQGALTQGAKGHAATHRNPYKSYAVTLGNVSSHPQTDGSYQVEITPDDQKGLTVVPGMKASVRMISKQADKAIVIPTAYLTRADDGGHTVKLKLADGKTTDRPVTVGASNKDTVMITKGLEIGQVILK